MTHATDLGSLACVFSVLFPTFWAQIFEVKHGSVLLRSEEVEKLRRIACIVHGSAARHELLFVHTALGTRIELPPTLDQRPVPLLRILEEGGHGVVHLAVQVLQGDVTFARLVHYPEELVHIAEDAKFLGPSGKLRLWHAAALHHVQVMHPAAPDAAILCFHELVQVVQVHGWDFVVVAATLLQRLHDCLGGDPRLPSLRLRWHVANGGALCRGRRNEQGLEVFLHQEVAPFHRSGHQEGVDSLQTLLRPPTGEVEATALQEGFQRRPVGSRCETVLPGECQVAEFPHKLLSELVEILLCSWVEVLERDEALVLSVEVCPQPLELAVQAS
mmetsp:Transcript_83877/g.184255  ORF Transcript_83877/g.184255 Transcript_83877/m.184255 type:complete len:330 (+) Transcript_83877:522-1511(+)